MKFEGFSGWQRHSQFGSTSGARGAVIETVEYAIRSFAKGGTTHRLVVGIWRLSTGDRV
jgi:hypothetical protein